VTSHLHTNHRYSIEELADPAPGGAGDFVESCYLLLNGELPTPEEKKSFNYDITRHSMVPEQLIQFYKVGYSCLPALTFSC
jgi:citrate synthase